VVGNDDICHRKPQNDKEIEACETYPHNMCLVLENAGKGGSYVAIPKIKTDHDKMDDDDDNKNNGNATSDDETDDEGISQKSLKKKSQGGGSGGGGAVDDALPPLSAATCQHWNDHESVQLHKLDADESYILDFTNTNNNTNNTIMIQCGRSESTFRITKMDWNISFSRIPTATMNTLRQQLPLIGAAAVAVPDDLPDASTTHLITSERIAGAKQLIAWCYQIPLTSPAFVQALLDRKTAADPWPDPVDYPVPPGDRQSFWDTTPDPKLLADYHFFSIELNELERLAVAAGAKLVTCYQTEKQEQTTDYDPLAKAQEILDQPGVVAFALVSRKKLAKQLQQLSPIVHMVTAKQLASSISQQACPLVDSKGKLIVVAIRPAAAAEQQPTPVEEPIKKTTRSRKPSVQEDVKPEPESPPVVESKQASRSKRRLRDESSEPKQESSCATIETETATQLPPPKKKSKVEVEPARSKVVQDAETSFPMADNNNNDEEEKPEMNLKSATGTSKLSTIPEPEQESSLSFEQDSSLFVEKKPTPLARPGTKYDEAPLGAKDADGWFVAAPKDDDHRKEIRKRAAKLMAQENGGIAFLPPADTATVTLSVEQQQPRTRTTTTTTSSSVRSSTTTGPNFKKFRKNSIRKPGSQARIALRHVLPKESQKQKALEVQHQALEEERRIADELFGDQAKTVKKRRRA
jgi:hypothetical protein